MGWDSSYTGQPIPAAEMREWLEHTVERIVSLLPGQGTPSGGIGGEGTAVRVLEIGCGTGMLLSRIAPRCTCYLGTDFSAAVLDILESRLKLHRHESPTPSPQRGADITSRVSLLERAADDFAGIGRTIR